MASCTVCGSHLVKMAITDTNRWALVIRKDQNEKKLGEVACQVCPGCGEIKLFLKDTKKLNKYLFDNGIPT